MHHKLYHITYQIRCFNNTLCIQHQGNALHSLCISLDHGPVKFDMIVKAHIHCTIQINPHIIIGMYIIGLVGISIATVMLKAKFSGSKIR